MLSSSQLKLHLDVRYPVLQELLGGLSEAKVLIKAACINLRLDGDHVCAELVPYRLYRGGHDFCAQTATALHRNDAANGRSRKGDAGREHTGIGFDAVLIPQPDMVRRLISIVDILIRAGLSSEKCLTINSIWAFLISKIYYILPRPRGLVDTPGQRRCTIVELFLIILHLIRGAPGCKMSFTDWRERNVHSCDISD